MMKQYDVVITGATIIDGSGQAGYQADLAIQGGTISQIGQLSHDLATQVIDASGLVLAPGFIDVHTHDDRALLMPGAMLPKLSQGVTTVVTGNCGLSLAPSRADRPIPPPLDLIMTPEWQCFSTFAHYIQALKQSELATNAYCLVGHISLRSVVMTELERPATTDECQQMQALLIEALEAGAHGLSTGTFYPPANNASIDEIITIGQPLRHYNGLYATHMRNEADKIIGSLQETFEIGRQLGVKVWISHHKLAGIANHGRSPETLALIAQAMDKQPVALDCYPYNASSTVLRPEFIARATSVLISWSVPHPELSGLTLKEIATQWACSEQQAVLNLMPAGAIYFMMDEQDVKNILRFPATTISSDGMPHDKHPHPRLWAAFTRVIGHYVRDDPLFDLATAIAKMTGLPAKELQLSARGLIKTGYAADLVLFDAERVMDSASYTKPQTCSDGIVSVWVNGQLAFSEGKLTAHYAGQVL